MLKVIGSKVKTFVMANPMNANSIRRIIRPITTNNALLCRKLPLGRIVAVKCRFTLASVVFAGEGFDKKRFGFPVLKGTPLPTGGQIYWPTRFSYSSRAKLCVNREKSCLPLGYRLQPAKLEFKFSSAW